MRDERQADAGSSQVGRPSRRESCRISALVSPESSRGLRTPCSRAAERLPPDALAGYSFMRFEDVDRHGVNLAVSFSLAGAFSGFVDSSVHWGSQGWDHRTDLTLMAGPAVRRHPTRDELDEDS